MTQDPLNWSLVALKRHEGTWRANSETGVGGGRIRKMPFKFNRIIIFFPLLTVLQNEFRRSMFRSLSGTESWSQAIANNHLLSDDNVWHSCYSFSTNHISSM